MLLIDTAVSMLIAAVLLFIIGWRPRYALWILLTVMFAVGSYWVYGVVHGW